MQIRADERGFVRETVPAGRKRKDPQKWLRGISHSRAGQRRLLTAGWCYAPRNSVTLTYSAFKFCFRMRYPEAFNAQTPTEMIAPRNMIFYWLYLPRF